MSWPDYPGDPSGLGGSSAGTKRAQEQLSAATVDSDWMKTFLIVAGVTLAGYILYRIVLAPSGMGAAAAVTEGVNLSPTELGYLQDWQPWIRSIAA